MTDPTPPIDIIRTKLYRPPVTRDFVPRTQLLDRLDHHRQRPLTLVSAPAGYGKKYAGVLPECVGERAYALLMLRSHCS